MGTIEATVDKTVANLEAQLASWGAKIDELASKTEQNKAEAKADYQKRLQDLRTQCSTAQTRLDEFKRAGNKNWETVRGGIENAWKDLDVAFQKLTR
jgi:predicted  nucleic acid-binding Zn-ribbon protein